MRVIAALLLLLCVCTGARAEKTEPFGVPFYTRSDDWAFDLQMKFLGEDKKVITAIANQVRQKPEKDWLTWTNQLVNLSPELNGKDACARLAVAKFEVLRQLGFSKGSLRLVYGTDVSGRHAVAAVHTPEGWRIFDTATVTGYKPPLDSEVRRFKAERSFY